MRSGGGTLEQAHRVRRRPVSPAELLPKKGVSFLQKLLQATGPPSAFYMSQLDNQLHHGKCDRAVTVRMLVLSSEIQGYCGHCRVTLFIPRVALPRIEWR